MTNDEIRKTAATVIAKARDNHVAAIPEGSAAFDYCIAAGDREAENALKSACFEVANPAGTPDPGREERERRWWALWDEIADEIAAYRERCHSRKYTGWSNASTEPIRYAGWK